MKWSISITEQLSKKISAASSCEVTSSAMTLGSSGCARAVLIISSVAGPSCRCSTCLRIAASSFLSITPSLFAAKTIAVIRRAMRGSGRAGICCTVAFWGCAVRALYLFHKTLAKAAPPPTSSALPTIFWPLLPVSSAPTMPPKAAGAMAPALMPVLLLTSSSTDCIFCIHCICVTLICC